jgi:hypothetical protein
MVPDVEASPQRPLHPTGEGMGNFSMPFQLVMLVLLPCLLRQLWWRRCGEQKEGC